MLTFVLQRTFAAWFWNITNDFKEKAYSDVMASMEMAAPNDGL
jgi:hypothetical protein